VENGALKGKACALIHNSFGHTPSSSYYNFMCTVLQAISDGCADTKPRSIETTCIVIGNKQGTTPHNVTLRREPRTFYLVKLDSN